MRSAQILTAAVALLAACSPPREELRADRRARITDGVEHTGHPAVGLLVFSRDGGTTQGAACTATLVGTRTVLTAAHCLGYPRTEFVDTASKAIYGIAATTIHESYDPAKAWLYDLGIVTLKNAPLALAPLSLSPAPPMVGQALTLIGFGETSKGAQDNGTKRLATNSVAAVQALFFTIDGTGAGTGNACNGDSGGPTLVAGRQGEVLNGLLSYVTGACGSTTRVTRLDLYIEWLRTQSAGDVSVDVAPSADAASGETGATTNHAIGGCALGRGESEELGLLLLLLAGLAWRRASGTRQHPDGSRGTGKDLPVEPRSISRTPEGP